MKAISTQKTLHILLLGFILFNFSQCNNSQPAPDSNIEQVVAPPQNPNDPGTLPLFPEPEQTQPPEEQDNEPEVSPEQTAPENPESTAPQDQIPEIEQENTEPSINDETSSEEPSTPEPDETSTEPEEPLIKEESTTLLPIDAAPVAARGAYLPAQVSSPLRGKLIALGAGHGYRGRLHSGQNPGKTLQRPWVWRSGNKVLDSRKSNNIADFAVVEDFINSEITHYLNEYLLNAGAKTTLVRELSRQHREIILCPNAEGYSESGPSVFESQNLSAQAGVSCSNNAHYNFVYGNPSTPSTARYSFQVPASGMYPLYFHFRDGIDRAQNIPVSIQHAGGTTRTHIDQSMRSTSSDAYGFPGLRNRVLYLGTFFFKENEPAAVTVSNNFTSDKIVVFDTLRVGGGMDLIPIDGQLTGLEKFKSSAFQYQKFLNRDATVARLSGSFNEDVTTRPHAANYEAADAFISVHNNATGQNVYPYTDSSGRGSMVIYQYGDESTFKPLDKEHRDLGLKMKYRLIDHLREYWDPDWRNFAWGDEGFNGNYGETRVAQVPSALIEVAFFTSPTELLALSNEKFYRTAARGIYQGIAQYFGAGWSPLEVTNVRVTHSENSEIRLEWDTQDFGPQATYFLVQTSKDGLSFDSGRIATTNSATFWNVVPGTLYSFKISAANAHGMSLPSAVVSIKAAASYDRRALIVNGFDRLDSRVNFSSSFDRSGAPVTIKRGNEFSYTPIYAQAIADSMLDWSVDSCDNESVIDGKVELQDYDLIIWYTGRESWADETFSEQEQNLLQDYLASGGNLIVSGSEIGWDLASQQIGNRSANDLFFLENYLRSRYTGDDAGTNQLLPGISVLNKVDAFSLDEGYSGTYQNQYPDYYSPVNGSVCVLEYAIANRCAALWYSGDYKLFSLGFPFEIVNSRAGRASLMSNMLKALEVN